MSTGALVAIIIVVVIVVAAVVVVAMAAARRRRLQRREEQRQSEGDTGTNPQSTIQDTFRLRSPVTGLDGAWRRHSRRHFRFAGGLESRARASLSPAGPSSGGEHG